MLVSYSPVDLNNRLSDIQRRSASRPVLCFAHLMVNLFGLLSQLSPSLQIDTEALQQMSLLSEQHLNLSGIA